MGFVSASVGGVIYLNWLRRKGIFQGRLGEDARDNVTLSTFTGDNEVPISESMDKFTIQLALVFLAYALAFLFMKGINSLLEPRRDGREGACGNGTGHDLGLPVPFQQRFRHAHQGGDEDAPQKGVMHREYTNTFMQNRIAGFMFDLMVVASIAAIDLSAFRDHRSSCR